MEPTGSATPSPGQTKSGSTKLSGESRVSRTMRRRVGVRRKRRSRVSGKLMALRLYRGGGGEGNAPAGGMSEEALPFALQCSIQSPLKNTETPLANPYPAGGCKIGPLFSVFIEVKG